jgi:hypothetical protein
VLRGHVDQGISIWVGRVRIPLVDGHGGLLTMTIEFQVKDLLSDIGIVRENRVDGADVNEFVGAEDGEGNDLAYGSDTAKDDYAWHGLGIERRNAGSRQSVYMLKKRSC